MAQLPTNIKCPICGQQAHLLVMTGFMGNRESGAARVGAVFTTQVYLCPDKHETSASAVSWSQQPPKN